MRDRRVYQEVFEREVRQALGYGHRVSNLFGASRGGQAGQAQHLALPAWHEKGVIQNPSSGAFYFMAGFSAAGGPDEAGP